MNKFKELYLIQILKGIGSSNGNMYYELQFYQDAGLTKNISQEIFKDMNSKGNKEIVEKNTNKDSLKFVGKSLFQEFIVFQHGSGTFLGLLNLLYPNYKTSSFKTPLVKKGFEVFKLTRI